jgi:hypothetical protein
MSPLHNLLALPNQAMARVVKPASQRGRVLLLEHARSDNPLLGAYQVGGLGVRVRHLLVSSGRCL